MYRPSISRVLCIQTIFIVIISLSAESLQDVYTAPVMCLQSKYWPPLSPLAKCSRPFYFFNSVNIYSSFNSATTYFSRFPLLSQAQTFLSSLCNFSHHIISFSVTLVFLNRTEVLVLDAICFSTKLHYFTQIFHFINGYHNFINMIDKVTTEK